MRYYKIENTVSGLVLGAYLAEDEEHALDVLAEDAGDTTPREERDDSEMLVTELWAVGDRVETGDIPEDYDTGRVIALEEEALDAVSPRARGYASPVAVAWDSGKRTVVEALDLREEGEEPHLAEEDEEATA